MQIKRANGYARELSRSKCNGGCQEGGNIMWKVKGQMDKGGHDDVQMKRFIQKGAL